MGLYRCQPSVQRLTIKTINTVIIMVAIALAGSTALLLIVPPAIDEVLPAAKEVSPATDVHGQSYQGFCFQPVPQSKWRARMYMKLLNSNKLSELTCCLPFIGGPVTMTVIDFVIAVRQMTY
ncbi:hypothetical protein GYMLUDRAFT_59157 [Collybiopsis luxurians FD-317 M1]|uniref:Uncharacterized protein n=1 Tax=Collybiopsis luxurians FD-317 M1 TaxID=944289 RepID=A0A0D0CQD3_9AGAR|nr:hypothetical protein GYMLUDRAFT_59157 [Collybiopsis luxurians FD-317 M1]